MAMALPEYRSEWIAPTDHELRERVRWWLDELGCTFAELEQMWRTGDYETPRHRFAWVDIGHLGDLAEA